MSDPYVDPVTGPVRNLAAFADESFDRLESDKHLRNRGRSEFVAGPAEYFGDVNALHPFREGNGRTQRAFFGQLTREAGYRVAWERLDARRNLDASAAGFHGDNEPLRTMLGELVEEPD